ncbi:hypothetical protein SAMN05421788_1011029 [Filimonas lacunae]|uniref:HTH cro/C1-type domain-containing protein n=1 Tax=Filimonas lacunae TaxID=477680 RepID=A0A173MPJ3_9BACT|nr:hypothetical protein [Filimonas lacunae]BAV09593.1 hypothetical protein FLA_5644 [Filimonas lacunae]SIS75665.1 hypothetical protein SAMN05421788_1011029 [Filimonas lacunae]
MAIHMGKTVKGYVKQKKLSVEQVSLAIGKVQSYVYKMYDKEQLQIGDLMRLSLLLNVNLFHFYSEDEALLDAEPPKLKMAC